VECFVVSLANAEGQQKVNNVAPERPKPSELIWLNQALRPAFARAPKRLASTFNPKVTGSIPVRPISRTSCKSRLLDSPSVVRPGSRNFYSKSQHA
jgi:hypothetical protein